MNHKLALGPAVKLLAQRGAGGVAHEQSGAQMVPLGVPPGALLQEVGW